MYVKLKSPQYPQWHLKRNNKKMNIKIGKTYKTKEIKEKTWEDAHFSFFIKNIGTLAGVAHSVGASSSKPESHGFNPGLWCSPLGGMCKRQPIHVSLSQQCFSSSLFSSLPLSLINKHVLRWGLKKKQTRATKWASPPSQISRWKYW